MHIIIYKCKCDLKKFRYLDEAHIFNPLPTPIYVFCFSPVKQNLNWVSSFNTAVTDYRQSLFPVGTSK